MSVTLLLIGITAAASFYAWKNPEIYRKWIMNPFLVQKNNEYWRFLSSGFIHADTGHLIFNMFSLYFMGEYLEQIFESWFGFTGIIYFLILYLAGIIISEIPSYFKHKKDYNYNSLGASGGVASVIFSFIMIAPTQNIILYFLPVPAFIFGALYLIYSYMQGKKSSDNINHDAHFYGAVFGILFTVLINFNVIFSFADQIIHWEVFSVFSK